MLLCPTGGHGERGRGERGERGRGRGCVAGAGAGAGAGADNAFELRFRQLDYDTQQAVQDALAAPRVPRIESYIREVQTGIYSR
ncbi:MAG: hypothetical protein RR653_11290 [Clostridia bacterium]